MVFNPKLLGKPVTGFALLDKPAVAPGAVLERMQKMRPNDPAPQAIYQRIQKTRQEMEVE